MEPFLRYPDDTLQTACSALRLPTNRAMAVACASKSERLQLATNWLPPAPHHEVVEGLHERSHAEKKNTLPCCSPDHHRLQCSFLDVCWNVPPSADASRPGQQAYSPQKETLPSALQRSESTREECHMCPTLQQSCRKGETKEPTLASSSAQI